MRDPLIDERLRRGLWRAADALPEFRPALSRTRPRWRLVAGAAAGAALVAGVAGLVLLRDDNPPGVTVADDPDRGAPVGPAEQPSGGARVTNGQVPGQAVALEDEIRLYGPDGTQTGAVSIAPLEDALGGASSDLNGGWVVCGSDGVPRYPEGFDPEELGEGGWMTTTTAPATRPANPDVQTTDEAGGHAAGPTQVVPAVPDQLMWFPAKGDPVVLDDFTTCLGGIQVIDTDQGPAVVRARFARSDDGIGLEATVLATRETHELPVTMSQGMRGSVATDRLLWLDAEGIHLYDLWTGDELPIAGDKMDVDEWAFVSLAPDARSVAVAEGHALGPVELTVYDLATGAELFQEGFDLPAEGLQLSYDGTRVAIGSYAEGNGPVTVIDLPSGDRHTIDAHGLVL